MNSAEKPLRFDFDADAFARRAPQPKISQRTFRVLKEIENRHGDGIQTVSNREDIRQIYRLFVEASHRDRLRTEFHTLKRIRQLAWALTYAENKPPFDQRIVDVPQLRDALRLIEDHLSISALRGVFDALLQAWDIPNAGMLRASVNKCLTNYDGTRKSVQKLKANMTWYCEDNGATQLALHLLRSQVKLSNVRSYLKLPDHTQGYRYFGAVAEEFVVLLNRPRDKAAVEDVVEFIEKHKDDKTSRVVLSKLIEQLGHDASEHLRESVQSYVLREWQDPRITGAEVRWRDISDKVKQIFTRWITKEDIQFFFDVVAKACNDYKFAYRKAFWLAYLEHISFCRPVLRRDGEHLFKNNPQALKYSQDRRHAILTGSKLDQHAFIIQMGGYTFVEFSTAAACYVYDSTNCPFNLIDSEYHMGNLLNQLSAEHRVIHRNSEDYFWQDKFSGWIGELGIGPPRSYLLGTYTDNNETDDIAELVQALGDKSTWIESNKALIKIGESAVPALIEALRDQDHRIRNRAIYTLGQLGEFAQTAIPALLERQLHDPKVYIRSQATTALKKIDTLSRD